MLKLKKETLNQFEVVILMTDHDSFDYGLIKKNSDILIDTRGKYKIEGNVIRA